MGSSLNLFMSLSSECLKCLIHSFSVTVYFEYKLLLVNRSKRKYTFPFDVVILIANYT